MIHITQNNNFRYIYHRINKSFCDLNFYSKAIKYYQFIILLKYYSP